MAMLTRWKDHDDYLVGGFSPTSLKNHGLRTSSDQG